MRFVVLIGVKLEDLKLVDYVWKRFYSVLESVKTSKRCKYCNIILIKSQSQVSESVIHGSSEPGFSDSADGGPFHPICDFQRPEPDVCHEDQS